MMCTNEKEIIQICKREENYLLNMLEGFSYDIKGILNSEMLLFCSISKFLGIKNIIESGRARGNSTEVLARYFKNSPQISIFSVEYSKYTEDSLIAMKRLCKYRNLKLYFANSLSLLPQLTKVGLCTVLIDGPKGKYALQLATFLLKNPKVKAVFMHDFHKDTELRSILDELYPNVFSSDNPDSVNTFSPLDKPCWDVYKNWQGYKDWGPYKSGKIKMKSYGPTLTMILNNEEGIDKEKQVLDRLGLEPICIKASPIRNILRKVRMFLPKISEIPIFSRYYIALIHYSLYSRNKYSESKNSN